MKLILIFRLFIEDNRLIVLRIFFVHFALHIKLYKRSSSGRNRSEGGFFIPLYVTHDIWHFPKDVSINSISVKKRKGGNYMINERVCLSNYLTECVF